MESHGRSYFFRTESMEKAIASVQKVSLKRIAYFFVVCSGSRSVYFFGTHTALELLTIFGGMQWFHFEFAGKT